MLPRPCAFCLAVNLQRRAARLPKLLVDSFAHALQQSGNIKKIIRSGGPHVSGDLTQVRIQSQSTAAQQASHQHDPRTCKTKRQVMKNGVLPRPLFHQLVFHQLIQSPRCAPEHVADVTRIQHHALRLTGSARGINDCDHIRLRDRSPRTAQRFASRHKNIVEREDRRRFRPLVNDCIAERLFAAGNHRRPAVLHHRDQFRGRLPRIQRNRNQPFRHDRQIHRYPADGIVRQQRAAVSLFQSQPAQICPRNVHLITQLPRRAENSLVRANLLQQDRAVVLLQARKYLLNK